MIRNERCCFRQKQIWNFQNDLITSLRFFLNLFFHTTYFQLLHFNIHILCEYLEYSYDLMSNEHWALWVDDTVIETHRKQWRFAISVLAPFICILKLARLDSTRIFNLHSNPHSSVQLCNRKVHAFKINFHI